MQLRGKTIRNQPPENISVEQRDDLTVLLIKNNLSYQTADEIKVIYPNIESEKILIDLGGVTLTTSRGMASVIRIVIDAHEKSRQIGLCNVSHQCMNIIDAMDIVTHIPSLKLFETLDEGIAHFQQT